MTSFVAGATGYTGQEIVNLLNQRGEKVVAHIRPLSSKRELYSKKFEALDHVTVDLTEWDLNALTQTVREMQPTVVYCAIGTTRARRAEADDKEMETYHAVDYGLTVMLARACVDAEIAPRFVYISAVGVSSDSLSEYMRARWEAETFIRHTELPYTIARPSFISGTDREEFRAGERAVATIGDVGLKLAGLIGFIGLRDKYSSMTATELAAALVNSTHDPEYENQILEPRALRKLVGV